MVKMALTLKCKQRG